LSSSNSFIDSSILLLLALYFVFQYQHCAFHLLVFLKETYDNMSVQ
jgi:hypothetical protein